MKKYVIAVPQCLESEGIGVFFLSPQLQIQTPV